MKKLIVLTALVLATGTVPSQACDYGAHAANSTPVVVGGTDEQTAEQPAAKPEPAAPKVTTAEPATPVSTTVLACQGSDC